MEYHICLLHTRAVHDRFMMYLRVRVYTTHKKKNDDGYYRTIAKAAAAPEKHTTISLKYTQHTQQRRRI